MNENSTKRFKLLMYVVAILILIMMIFPFLYTHLTTIHLYKNQEFVMEEGRAELSQYSIAENKPFNLNGEWIVYSDVYFEGDSIEYERLSDGELVKLPIRDLEKSKGTKTYQLNISVDLSEEIDSAVLSIPFATDSIRVYVNGTYVEGFYPMQSWSGFDSSGKMYDLGGAYDGTLEYQEIIVSINQDSKTTDLFNREISLSTIENILGMEKMSYVMQAMLVSMMFIMALIGAVYILIMPTYSVLTFMSLFDTALMLHLFFNMSTLPQVVMDSVTLGTRGDILFRKLDLVFLFLAGFLANILASAIFDKDKKYHKFFYAPINISYVILIIIYILSPSSMDGIALWITLLLAMTTLIGIGMNFARSGRKAKNDTYTKLHFGKTIWIGMVIIVDVTTINSTDRPRLFLAMLYTLFFLAHLVIRALEYRRPYLKIAETNESLERIVEERTKGLLEANEVLRMLSVKDALTKAYNRLYFEEELVKILEQYQVEPEKLVEVHLCVFDLDNFKAINDNYGHAEGDEQLIETVCIVNEEIEDDVIFSRIGGEEFTLLFKNYGDDHVLEIVERIRRRLEEAAAIPERTTGSFGVSKAQENVTRKQLFGMADTCLYYAKAHGKNQVVYDYDGTIKTYL